MNKFIEFDALNVPLEKKNLVEASAGTGKTFSIAVMVLRLILEKDINIKEILLVTFTNNAVAELDERVRMFLRSAFEYANSNKATSDVIQTIVNRCIDKEGKEAVIRKLNNSILFLDETSVMTIHSFCHETLSNLAFETGQLFVSELVTNLDDIVVSQVQEFWRNEIVTLPIEILSLLQQSGFDQKNIINVIATYLSGKRYYAFDENVSYKVTGSDRELVTRVQNFDEFKNNSYQKLASILAKQKDSIKTNLEKNKNARVIAECIDEVNSFVAIVREKRDKQYVEKNIPGEILEIIDILSEEEQLLEQQGSAFVTLLYCSALENVVAGVSAYCSTKGIQSFDSLIKNLYTALKGSNREKIIAALKRKYRAAFIDEFQDTDKWQYDIFLDSFGKDVVLFLIGDPKQSIYAFRQADINTYFKAYKDADYLYSMNVNFRSSTAMIESMNEFFMPQQDFDFFYFQNAQDSIKYFVVSSPTENTKGYFLTNNNRDKGISICTNGKKEEILKDAAQRIFQLLTNSKYCIETTEGKRKIIPADIGILVKNKNYGHEIRKYLGQYNIPSVFVADEKIMETEEAKELYRLIEAIYDPVVENINGALVNSFTGYKSTDAVSFDVEHIIELFKGYKQTWESQSIYSCLATFISDFGIEDYLRNPETFNGLRIITNLYQLMELLQKTAYHQHLKQAELLSWYKRALELDLMEKDESTIRLESDADAVTIMTIHKSKGLQFNIVFAVQMNLEFYNKNPLVSIYENDEYITLPKEGMNEQQKAAAETQSEQEFRRLMYVAVTRAVYKCFVFNSLQSKKSALTEMIPKLRDAPSIDLTPEVIDLDSIDYTQKYKRQKNEKPVPEKLKNKFQLKDPHWRYMSYSRLAAKDTFALAPADEIISTTAPSEYDEFVFKKLRKGNITGNMVHYIFERIDFRNPSHHEYIIADAVRRFAASNTEIYTQWLPTFADHVLNSIIHTGTTSFQLSDIGSEARVAEMEFDFSTIQCNASQLTAALKEAGLNIQLKGNEPLHGLMKGFIDLLFEHEGKYYILDWKTNFLGDRVEDYESSCLESAMEQLNYQLQLVIYTLAVKKYLFSRLGDFDDEMFGGVIYCFVRGMRKGTSNGIYFYRPQENLTTRLESILASAVHL